jgi:cyanophycin synthetase
MVFTSFSVHHGPSVYAHFPVIRYTVAAAYAGGIAPVLRSTLERVVTLLPGLREHFASCHGADLPVPHVFEHVGIELQNLTGAELRCVRAQGARIAEGDAVIPYEDERIGLEAGNLSLELIEGEGVPDVERRLRAFLRFAERQRLPVQDRAVVRAAEARDIPVIQVAGRVIQLGHGRHQQRMNATETTHTSIVGNTLAANKDYARRILLAAGLPVPLYERVHRERDAVVAAKRIGFPVVVKPNNRNMGVGVSVGVRRGREVREAFRRAREHDRSILVEKFIAGADYRMLVIDGKLEAAAKRVPAHVVGDGVHTIEELVARANEDPRRGGGQRSSWTRLELDDEAGRLLAELGYDRASTPRDGQSVPLKRVANTSAGGTAVDVTDEVHPENRWIAERAARAIGLDVAGVDLLVPDIRQPLRDQGGVICEVNSKPGIRKHLWPAEGRPRDVIGPILDMLFPSGSRSRIPIAVVTGSGDRAGVARMLADLLATDGATIGLAASDGVFIRGSRADGGELDGPSAARLLLLDPTVECAVLEVSPDEAYEHGLGYDWADACAVINDEPLESPDLVDALRLVVGSSRAHVVVSAEDQERYGLKPHPAARVWRVSAGLGEDSSSARSVLKATALALGFERRLANVSSALVS